MNEKDIRAAIQKVREALGPSPGVVFMPVALGAVLGLTTCKDPFGCGVAVYGIEETYGITTTTSSHSTTTTTWTTSEPECDVDLVQTMGATEQCNECVKTNCCSEAQGFAISPTGYRLAELFDCAIGADEAGPCASTCTPPQCGYGPVGDSAFFYVCNVCITHSCCPALNACYADQICRDGCISGDDSACCEAASPYELYDQCVAASCAAVCPAILLCPASHPGEGGTGGGGSGGSGGAGGHGGGGGIAGGGGAAGVGGAA
jgi:uncharacterized membrane protein YgcG